MPLSQDLRALRVAWWAYIAWATVANFVALLVVAKLLLEHRRNGVKNIGSFLTHLVIANLALADFGNGLVSLVTFSYANGDYFTLSSLGCSVFGAFINFANGMSIMMTLLLGYLRYRFLVHRPLSTRWVQVFIVIAYGCSVALSLFTSLTGGSEPRPSGFYCYFAIGRRDWISAFQTVTAIVLCIVPSLGILILYRQAYANLKADEKSMGKGSQYSPKVARVGVAIVVVYFVTLVPYSGVLIYRLIVDPEQTLDPITDAGFGLLALLNFGLNPVVYFMFQHEMSNVVRSYIPCAKLLKSTLGNSSASGVSSTGGSNHTAALVNHSRKSSVGPPAAVSPSSIPLTQIKSGASSPRGRNISMPLTPVVSVKVAMVDTESCELSKDAVEQHTPRSDISIDEKLTSSR